MHPLRSIFSAKDFQEASLALLKQLERKLGLTKTTTDANSMAMPLAKRRGFVVVTKQTIVHKGVELTNYVMEKFLT